MPDNTLDEHAPKSPLDYFHFALATLGFFVAATGVVITSVRVVLCGLIMLGWGLAYFYASRE